MHKIIFTVQANTSSHVFDYNEAAIAWVFRMYDSAALADYHTHQNYCIDQGWLDDVPEYSLDDLESIQNAHAHPTSCVYVDTSNNSFTHVMTGADLQAVWDWYVLEQRAFEPMVDHYAANPGEGAISATIMYGSIPQTIDLNNLYA